MSQKDYLANSQCPWLPKLSHMRVGSATNQRSAISAVVAGAPTGDTAAIFYMESWRFACGLIGIFNSLLFDFVTRSRLVGLHLDYHVFAQNPLPRAWSHQHSLDWKINAALSANTVTLASAWPAGIDITSTRRPWRMLWSITPSERARLRAVSDTVVAGLYGLQFQEVSWVLKECDYPAGQLSPNKNNPKAACRRSYDHISYSNAFRILEQTISESESLYPPGTHSNSRNSAGSVWLFNHTGRLGQCRYRLGVFFCRRIHFP